MALAGRKIGALAEQGAGKSDGGLLIEHAGQLGEGRGCIAQFVADYVAANV